MKWHSDAKVTLSEIDAIRIDKNTDSLTRFVFTLPVFLLVISALFFYFSWQLFAINGVNILNLFTQPIYQNGVDGKQTSIFLFIPLSAILGYLGVWMLPILYCWAGRRGKPPLIVTDTHVQFSGTQYPRNQISHFEHQHWNIHGAFVMVLNDGQTRRFPTAFVTGAPVREIASETAKQDRDFLYSRLFLTIAAPVAVGLLLIIALLL